MDPEKEREFTSLELTELMANMTWSKLCREWYDDIDQCRSELEIEDNPIRLAKLQERIRVLKAVVSFPEDIKGSNEFEGDPEKEKGEDHA